MRVEKVDHLSPVDCDHFGSLFIQSSRGTPLGDMSPAPDRHCVRLCPKCGQFEVAAHKGSEYIEVRFTLPTQELVNAAGRYLAYLNTEEPQPAQS